MTERLYKVDEVAKLFEVKPDTIRVWLRDGTLRGVKIGKGHYWRVPASAVEELATDRWGDNES
jgi:excisionase family DNA binding protein